MDPRRFDALARAVATPRQSRRSALRRLGAGALAGTLGAAGLRPARAEDATPAGPAAKPAPAEVLFVQTAAAGSFVPQAGAAGTYELILTGAPAQTVYFADRPERSVGTVATGAFLDGRAFDPADPPNAALVAQTEAGEDVLVVELLSPAYDAAAGTVRYDALPLADYQGEGLASLAARQGDGQIAERFAAASLFIDGLACAPNGAGCDQNGDCCSGKCCLSLAGCFGGICAG